MKNKFLNFRTVAQIVLLVLVAILAVAWELVVDFNLSRLLTLEFWASVAVKLIVTIICYNIIFTIDNTNRRAVEDSKYFVTLATNKIRIDRIYSEKRFAELKEAVDKENEDNKVSAYDSALHEVDCTLSYADIKDLDDDGVEQLKDKRLYSSRQFKKIKKVISKIRRGRIRFEFITPEDILFDKEGRKDSVAHMKMNTSLFVLKNNAMKIGSFLLCSIALGVVEGVAASGTNLWFSILSNLTLIAGALVSAVSSSFNYVKMRTNVFDARNRFLERRLDMHEVFDRKT